MFSQLCFNKAENIHQVLTKEHQWKRSKTVWWYEWSHGKGTGTYIQDAHFWIYVCTKCIL